MGCRVSGFRGGGFERIRWFQGVRVLGLEAFQAVDLQRLIGFFREGGSRGYIPQGSLILGSLGTYLP